MLADEQEPFAGAVPFVSIAAVGAGLTGVIRIYLDGKGHFGQGRLVGDQTV